MVDILTEYINHASTIGKQYINYVSTWDGDRLVMGSVTVGLRTMTGSSPDIPRVVYAISYLFY